MQVIDSIRLAKYKESRIKGNSKSKAMLDAGYKPTTAYHCQNDTLLVKLGDKAIKEEFKLSCVTPELVISNLLELANNAKTEGNKVRCWELIGKYLALFTDSSNIKITEAVSSEGRSILEQYIGVDRVKALLQTSS